MIALPVGKDHIWAQVFESAERFTAPRPALFLDRDGVIVEEVHYLADPEQVRLIEGAASLIKAANARDIAVVIVTNQSGIARGYFDWGAFQAVQDKMLTALKAKTGAVVDAVYACPFHEKGQAPYAIADHEARKPNAGMLTRAHTALPIQLENSWIIGDKAGDLKAGLRAGLQGGVHVLTGHGRDEGEADKVAALKVGAYSVKTCNSIADVSITDLL